MHFEVEEEMAYSPGILSRYPGYQVSKVLDKEQCLHFVSLVLNHFLLTQLSLKKSCCVVMHFYRSVPQIRPPLAHNPPHPRRRSSRSRSIVYLPKPLGCLPLMSTASSTLRPYQRHNDRHASYFAKALCFLAPQR